MASDAELRPPLHPSKGFAEVLTSFSNWWRTEVSGTVDQAAVIERRREECLLSARYLLLLSMSAGIAILGLLLSSPAVVIGAMLLSPLMGPIMGLGFAFAVGDFPWIRESARSLAIGTLLAVMFCAVVVFFSPIQTVTSEIAARTKPNLFDLLVALFSSVAGAYAMIRGRADAIVGVAIATALMPPLAVVGFGLATFNMTVFSGALLLFVTNLVTIALTAAIMARLYGFRTNLSERQTTVQTLLIIGALLGLAIPLGISLNQIRFEANATRQINDAVLGAFNERARISQIETDFASDPIRVSATVLTPDLRADAERIIAEATARKIGEPVEVKLTQYRVGTSAQAAEEAQLRTALASEQADAAAADELAERLALVAGVKADQVLVDRGNRRAMVRAAPLEGATLRAYSDLERRVAAVEPEWKIELIPPVRPIPSVTYEAKPLEDGQESRQYAPSSAGQANLALAAWAALRLGDAIQLSGPADAVEAARAYFTERNVTVTTEPRGSGFGTVDLGWADPNGFDTAGGR